MSDTVSDETLSSLLTFGLFVVATYIGLFLLGFLPGVLPGLAGLSMTEIAGRLITITFYAGVFGLLALALNLHWGYTGLFNIGIAGFMAIGVYVMILLSAPTDPLASPVGGFNLPVVVGVAGGMIVAAVIAILLAVPTLNVRADYFAIITLGFAEIVRLFIQSDTVAQVDLGDRVVGTGGGRAVQYTPPIDVVERGLALLAIDSSLGERFIYAVVVLLLMGLVVLLLRRIARSPYGRVLKAIREDEIVARSLGKNTRFTKVSVFALGASLMALGGILWHGTSSFVEPDLFLPIYTFFIFTALIIGGSGSNLGAVAGGFAFSAFLWEGPRYLRTVVDENIDIDAPSTIYEASTELLQLNLVPLISYFAESLNELRWVFIGTVLIVLMIYRPDGIYGHHEDTAAAIDLSNPFDGGEKNE